MSKSPVLGFCDSEVMSDEKKLPHASGQGNVGLLVVIAHEVFVERSSVLIVLDTVHKSQV
jgi:copper chaperone CopZ